PPATLEQCALVLALKIMFAVFGRISFLNITKECIRTQNLNLIITDCSILLLEQYMLPKQENSSNNILITKATINKTGYNIYIVYHKKSSTKLSWNVAYVNLVGYVCQELNHKEGVDVSPYMTKKSENLLGL
ncbi:hypothetical protein ACJX0J_041714, partial [Zea mays]